MRLWTIALVVLALAAPAQAQEEPMPAPPPDAPVGQPPPPPPQPQPYPPQPQPPPPYPVQYPQPGYPQPGYPPPGYPPPGYAAPGYAPPGYMVRVQLEPNRTAQRVAIYGELLGKGFLYGVGADVNITSWLGLGAAFSYYKVSEWQLGVVAPYVNLYPVGGHRSSMLFQIGPQILFAGSGSLWIWKEQGNYVIGQVSIGYEYRHGFLFRAMLTSFFNEYGYIPWPGFTFGGAF